MRHSPRVSEVSNPNEVQKVTLMQSSLTYPNVTAEYGALQFLYLNYNVGGHLGYHPHPG